MKKSLNTQKHLTLNDRRIILEGIQKGSTLTSIADVLGKDKSTIGKEIKLHRRLTHQSSLPLECGNWKDCKYRRKCKLDCPGYVIFKCNRRDRSPGACNGCQKHSSCHYSHYMYTPEKAQNCYERVLTESREGFNITPEETEKIAHTIGPLLKNGQSIYMALQEHPEIGLSEKTIYNYIEAGLFKPYGLDMFVLRQKLSRKLPKERKNLYKQRTDRRYLELRKYVDYLAYMDEHSNATIVEMDTVYNDIKNGPFIQTFKFVKYGFLFGILSPEKKAENMYEGVNLLEEILGFELFFKNIEVLLTDRGSEFVMAKEMETSKEGLHRTQVFYCDPMGSGQKGSLENNHKELRYILPHSYNMRELGLTSQDALNLALSHINSAPKEKLDGKSPIQLMKFLNPELFTRFEEFGIHEIEQDFIILKPSLLKDFR